MILDAQDGLTLVVIIRDIWFSILYQQTRHLDGLASSQTCRLLMPSDDPDIEHGHRISLKLRFLQNKKKDVQVRGCQT